jgi:hypothetical protein
MNTAITAALASYVTSTALTNALAAYTDTTTLNTLLAAKQNTLTAGTGISITGATISSTHTPIILQLDGTTQTGGYYAELRRQHRKFCEQCAEHLPHGMAGCRDATIQQLSK